MDVSRRQSIQLSAGALAALSAGALQPSAAFAQGAPQPDKLVEGRLR